MWVHFSICGTLSLVSFCFGYLIKAKRNTVPPEPLIEHKLR